MGRLIDIENIDYVRLEDSLHCLEHHKGDEVECVICAPTVDAIPKADYENRLKADLVAMLEEIDLEMSEQSFGIQTEPWEVVEKLRKKIIQQKINSLKEA